MRIFELVGAATRELLATIEYVVVSNLWAIAMLVDGMCPYVMYVLGQYRSIHAGGLSWGIELVLPIVIAVVVFYYKAIANRLGKGDRFPVPAEPFTEVHDDGEVTVRQDRLQEMILYVADVEDWLERHDRMQRRKGRS